MKRKTALFLVIALVFTMLAGCGSSPSSSTPAAPADPASPATSNDAPEAGGPSGEVTFAVHFVEGTQQADAVLQMAKDFMEEYPEIKVIVELNGQAQVDKLKPRFKTGSEPEIIFAGPDYARRYWDDELLEPLTDFIDEANYDGTGTVRDSLYPASVSMCTLDGEVYCMPLELCVSGWYYNKKIFAQYGLTPPETWEDMVNIMKTLDENGIAPIAMDGNVSGYLGWFFENAAGRRMGFDAWMNLLKNKDSSVWDDPYVLEAAQIVEKDIVPYFQKGLKGTQYPAANALFAQGAAAMTYCASWFPQEIVSITPDDFEYGMFLWPKMPGSVEDRTIVEGKANMLCITKYSDNKEAAKVFLKYLMGEKCMTAFSSIDMCPTNIHVDPPATQEGTVALIQQADIVTEISWNIESNDIRDWTEEVVFPSNSELCYGELTAEQFVQNVKAANDIYWAKH